MLHPHACALLSSRTCARAWTSTTPSPFGPTVSVYEVDDDDEAIRIANDTDYGLSSAVFTEDLRRGLKIAKQIETGAVHINSMTVHDETGLPHGGAKKSGFGRFNGREGLEEWVRTKIITFKD